MEQFEKAKEVRDSCEDARNTLKDLYKWEQEIKEKEKHERNSPGNNEDLPGIRSHVADRNAKNNRELVNGSSASENDEIISVLKTSSPEKTSAETSPQKTAPSKKELANIAKENGNSQVKLGNYEEALVHYTEAIKNFDSDSVFYTNRALCFLKLEKYDKCIEDCNVAIKLAPKSIKAFYRRMLAYESLGDLEKSLADCTKVLNMDPGNLDAKKSQDRIKKRKNNFAFNLSRSFQNISAGNIHEPTWTQIDGYMKEIPAIIKPPHLRSKNLLKRIAIEEVLADEDSNKNEITDEIIDKLFNSNDCGSFKQIDAKDSKHNKDRKIEINLPKEKKNITLPDKPKTQAQFYAAWKELNNEQKYLYLKQIEPNNIVKILGAGFEIETLSEILSILSENYLNDNCDVSILIEIAKHEGMSILSLFLSDEDHKALKKIVNYMKTNNYDAAKIQFVNKKFGIRN